MDKKDVYENLDEIQALVDQDEDLDLIEVGSSFGQISLVETDDDGEEKRVLYHEDMSDMVKDLLSRLVYAARERSREDVTEDRCPF